MKNHSRCISQNLLSLRRYHRYSQEEVAEKIGVSRQAVAKWETGETIPDILNCDALAELYNVSVDDLIHFDQTVEKISIPPKGKHLFGTVKVGDRGQIVLPKRARDIFHIKSGDLLVVLGDETPEHAGIALVPGDSFLQTVEFLQSAMRKRNDTEALETEGIK
ncbi:MAG TPA: helix-turn-helix domain-containing protein [Firmicutes bacterium]|nr:helix-turn-helix domain-containing protein [Bacillota bacterium]